MAEPEKTKRPIVRRRMTPISTRYEARPDAVNETLRVNGLAPEQTAARAQAVEGQRRLSEQRARQQKIKRDQYRANRQAQDRANGIVFSIPMSDEQVDLAMQQEAQAANQPQLRQGYSESERQARRQAGLLYTQEDREQAKRLAEMHNASFFGSMVAPPISPEMAENNPGYVNQVVRGDAMVLPNAFLSGLSFGTPSASTAALNGVRQGWQAAGNFTTRATNAAVQGARAVKPVVTNPRWAMVTGGLTIPSMTEAYNGVEAGGPSSHGTGAWPWVVGGAALTAGGAYLFSRFKGKTPAIKDPTSPRYLTLWERHPVKNADRVRYQGYATRYNNAVATGDQAALDVLKTDFKKSPNATITQGSGKKAKEVPNPDYLSNTDLGLMIQNRTYPTPEGTFIYTPRQNAWRHVRNYSRVGLLGGAAGFGGYGAYQMFQGNDSVPPQPDNASVTMQSQQAENPSDTIVPKPRFDEAPVTTSTQNQLDSINQALFNGQSIQ